MRKLFASQIILSLLLLPLGASAQMNSSNYRMHSDSMNFAGVLSTSTNYSIEDTAGEAGSGLATSSNYNAFLGYQFMTAVADNEAPSQPPSITAQVISDSEVELTWGDSTDNVGVSRYYIYRDGVRIDDVATFPRSYSDAGLSAATTYSYNVSAVDDAQNESLWSGTTTVATLASPVSSGGGGGGGGARAVSIDNLQISSNDKSASISFTSSFERAAEIYWSKDLSYNEGSLVGPVGSNHHFVLGSLTPGTFYNVRIILRDNAGNPTSFENITFRTLSVAVSQAPANVRLFSVTPLQEEIALSWKLPLDNRVVGVRIIRNSSAYPANPNDGVVILDSSAGRVESYQDQDVVAGVQYYYAIFTEDLAGNLSSGVLGTTKIVIPGELPSVDPLENLLPAGEVHPLIEALTLDDFLFIQSGDSVEVRNNAFTVRNDKNITVALKYHQVPPVLKTIAVTLLTQEANPKKLTFILRPNRDMTRYEATIGALETKQVYSIRINILDFKNQGMRTIEGNMRVMPPVATPRALSERTKQVLGFGGAGLLALAILVYASRNIKKRKLPLINTAGVTQ